MTVPRETHKLVLAILPGHTITRISDPQPETFGVCPRGHAYRSSERWRHNDAGELVHEVWRTCDTAECAVLTDTFEVIDP